MIRFSENSYALSEVCETTATRPVSRGRNQVIGEYGESLAVQYFQNLGYTILSRNWRYRAVGELDLVLGARECVVAVEVKTRTGTNFGHPLEAITATKLQRIRRLLGAWAADHRVPHSTNLRVDALGIVVSRHEPPCFEYVQGIQ